MRILLVEDNRTLAEWLQRTLVKDQYAVDLVDNGVDADCPWRPIARTRSSIPRRASGSPPVSRMRATPRAMKASASAASSSTVSTSRRGRKAIVSLMQ